MSKISLEEVQQSLLEQKVDNQVVTKIITDLEKKIQEEKDNKVSAPKSKNEFLIIISDPNNELAGKDLTGWVVTQRQGLDSSQILSKIRDSIKEMIDSQKRKKFIVSSLGEGIERLKRKFLAPKEIMVKTKNPVQVLITDNKL